MIGTHLDAMCVHALSAASFFSASVRGFCGYKGRVVHLETNQRRHIDTRVIVYNTRAIRTDTMYSRYTWIRLETVLIRR